MKIDMTELIDAYRQGYNDGLHRVPSRDAEFVEPAVKELYVKGFADGAEDRKHWHWTWRAFPVQ